MRRSICLAALAAVATGAHAGSVLESANKNLEDGSTNTVVTHAQSGMLHVEAKPGDTSLVFKDDTVYIVNHPEKSYVVLDRASMKRMAEVINPTLKLLQEQMSGLPPEQRAQMEKMIGGSGKTPVQEMRKTSRTGKVGAHSCSYVELLQDGVLSDELCIAPASTLEGGEEIMVAAGKMAALMNDLMASLDSPWLKQMVADYSANFAKLGGIPLTARHFANGKATHETTLKSIRRESLPAERFAVPPGYARKDMIPQP